MIDFKQIKTPGVIIFDMDDVLVSTTPKSYNIIQQHWIDYMATCYDYGILTEKEVYDRYTFGLIEWIATKETLNNPKLLSAVKQVYHKQAYSLDCYNGLKPTKLMENTLLNPAFMNSNVISKIYILSRSATPEMTKAKMEWLGKYVQHPKVDIVIISTEHTKLEAIQKLNIDFCLMIDDELSNIMTIAENFDITNREFMLPRFGYNKIMPEQRFLIEAKGGSISYYDPF